MDELPFHKVFIDSRTASLGTASSFEVTLPETLSLSREAVCYVTDIAISHSFCSVDGTGTVGGANHFVYFVEVNAVGANPIMCRAALTEGSYTAEELGGELAARMTAASYVGAAYTAAYRPSLNALQVNSSKGFLFVNKDLLQDAEFQAYFGTPTRLLTSAGEYTLSWAAPEDCCGLLGLARGGSKNLTFAELLSLNSFGGEAVQVTGHVDVRRRHCLYLHSQALANLRALGPGGSRTVLARMPVDSVYGGLVAKQHNGHMLDFQPCGGRTLRTLDFSLRDSFGNLVDLRGGHVSFELLFAPKPLV
mgnify:FL=1